MSRQDIRKGRIPQKAVEHGDFVIDITDVSNYLFSNDPDMAEDRSIMTANGIMDTGMDIQLMHYDRRFPVYDAIDGSSIGKMTARDFLRKML